MYGTTLTQTLFAHFHRVLLLSLLRIEIMIPISVVWFIVDHFCLLFYCRPLFFYFRLFHRKAAFIFYIHFRWPGCCYFYRFWLHLALQTDQKSFNSYSCSNSWMGKSAITWTFKWNRWHRKNSPFKKHSCTQFWIWNLWYGFLYPLDWFITGNILPFYAHL